MSRPNADKRLERLLVMVPWVSQREGPTVEEVCKQFAISESELEADLQLLFICGLYPFTPDALIEADIVDGQVWIRFSEAFERPPAFTRQEAVTLLAAASAVVELPQNEGNAALRSALQKLAAALGVSDDDVIGIELASAPAGTVEVVRRAIADTKVIELDYYSYGKDSWARRRIHPYRMFNSEGQWYLQGLALEADELRNFRADRMRSIDVLDQTFDLPDDIPEPRVYEPRPEDPVVVLELDDSARWVAEQYPLERTQQADNAKLRVTMRVSETRWLERLLLRAGPGAHLVEGRVDVRRLAARLAARYKAPRAATSISTLETN